MFCFVLFLLVLSLFLFFDLGGGGALKPQNRGFVIEEVFFLIKGVMPDQAGPTISPIL